MAEIIKRVWPLMLALVVANPASGAGGWYLMVPTFPTILAKGISTWHQYEAFGSARECGDYRKALIERTEERYREAKETAKAEAYTAATLRLSAQLDSSLCIASDDVRLRENK